MQGRYRGDTGEVQGDVCRIGCPQQTRQESKPQHQKARGALGEHGGAPRGMAKGDPAAWSGSKFGGLRVESLSRTFARV